ncbi:hypothetical protein SARC_02884 [Sphaeroforma arctica JP610]|uniref:Amino acid transporter transmembrane domain-containing protein n=1 Tax=Sphaeroforma arctica JP610 TaxID=667725 RepID=A0A0L0G782_9EUKA|nr:hypothetical protein SARC_02884 [Sphaeroforma arctica JP610]KNC84902.1 hypothetical protein SARC_02884 [Sphaeroforma arctica JP610]|eukprot:XP_014158804.1 hypothetical protein SARC_02884 [Sphaeroforma arctica JP610]
MSSYSASHHPRESEMESTVSLGDGRSRSLATVKSKKGEVDPNLLHQVESMDLDGISFQSDAEPIKHGSGILTTSMNMTNTIIGSAMQVLPDVVRTVTGDHEDEDSFYVQKWFWLLICWAIGAGLSLLKSTYYLGHISVVAVGVVGYTVFVVFAYCVGIFDPCEGIPAEECYTEPKMFDGGFFDFMKAFPVFVLSFCCAPTMFNIYNALETQSKHNMTLSSAIAMCVCSVLYATISLCGYFTYGTHVAENILDSYPISVVASLARFGMAFVVTVSYPLLMHSSRDGFLHGISTLVKYTGKVDLANDIADNTTKTGNIVFYIFAVLLNLLVLVIAYLELSLNSLMSVSGALSSNLSFTLPAVLYYKAYEEDGWTWMRIVCIPFAVFGIVVTGISLWANIA